MTKIKTIISYIVIFLILSSNLLLASPLSISTFNNDSDENNSSRNISDINDKAEEIYLNLKYAGLVNTTITAYYYDGKFFLPFGEIYSNLEINYSIDDKSKIISGFYIDKFNPYSININTKIVEFVDSTYIFTFGEYLQNEFEYFFDSDFYERIFKLNLKIDFQRMVINVQSSKKLPIYERSLREKSYSVFNQKGRKQTAPLLYPRKRKIIDLGIFDYHVGFSTSKFTSPSGSYQFGLGGEFIGGDAQVSIRGIYREIKITDTTNVDYLWKFTDENVDYLWRFVVEPNDYFRYASIGSLNFDGLQSRSIKGISLSNNQVEPRRNYASYRVFDKAMPNWTIEVYINNQLIDIAKADAVGDFYFDLPLAYGTTMVQMKFYGPGGEYYDQERLYQTPFFLLRPKEFVYFVDFGKAENINSDVASLRIGYGFNEWLTDEVGIEYIENDLNRPIVYNSLTTRIAGSYLLNLTVAPDAYYQFAANVLYFSQTSFGLEYRKFVRDGIYNPGNLIHDAGANIFIPIRFLRSQLNFKGSADYTETENNKLYNYSIGSSASLAGFNPSLNYNYIKSISSEIENSRSLVDLGFSWSISSVLGYSKIFSGNLITARGFFGLDQNKFENISISFATSILRNSRFQISYFKNFINSVSTAQLQLIVYLPGTQLSVSGNNDALNFGLLGSISYDTNFNDVHFYNRPQLGRAAAAFRFFVDENGNSEYDDGEELVKDVNINMGTSVLNRDKDGIIYARELNQYEIYSVDIDESSVKNPVLVPMRRRFSFVADPNRFKSIDVPFYVAGEVDGKIEREVGNIRSSVSGIKIHIISIEDNREHIVTTFSDGTYYFFGLRPGKYKAVVDERQLEILGVTPDPEIREFIVETEQYGDIVRNINFILRK